MPETHVYMVNDDTKGVWDCPADYVPIAEQRGWVQAERPVPVPTDIFDPEPEPETQTVTGFDPADHDVDGVNDYLAPLVDESPGEVARVLEAESAGKARKGILAGPYAPSDPSDDEHDPDTDADNGDDQNA